MVTANWRGCEDGLWDRGICASLQLIQLRIDLDFQPSEAQTSRQLKIGCRGDTATAHDSRQLVALWNRAQDACEDTRSDELMREFDQRWAARRRSRPLGASAT